MDFFPSQLARGWGREVADVSQIQDCGSDACGVGRDEFLARAGAEAGQDGGCLVVVYK